VFLRRNVIAVAGRALKANLQRLGPLVLPVSELVRPGLPASACRTHCMLAAVAYRGRGRAWHCGESAETSRFRGRMHAQLH